MAASLSFTRTKDVQPKSGELVFWKTTETEATDTASIGRIEDLKIKPSFKKDGRDSKGLQQSYLDGVMISGVVMSADDTVEDALIDLLDTPLNCKILYKETASADDTETARKFTKTGVYINIAESYEDFYDGKTVTKIPIEIHFNATKTEYKALKANVS